MTPILSTLLASNLHSFREFSTCFLRFSNRGGYTVGYLCKDAKNTKIRLEQG
jgi:hypothetical protein